MNVCDICGNGSIVGNIRISVTPTQEYSDWTHPSELHFTKALDAELCRSCYLSLKQLDLKAVIFTQERTEKE